MFRNVYFMSTVPQEAWDEMKALRLAVHRYMRGRMYLNGTRLTEAKAESVAARERLKEIRAQYMITSESSFVELRTVKGEVCYDVIELPAFLHRECMLPMLIQFIIGTVDDRHNGAAEFKHDFSPWSFHDIIIKANQL